MQHSNFSAESIVKSAHSGEYAVPEFQRGFVWTPAQVLEFADSLSKKYPVGSILTWKSSTAIQRGDSNQTRQKSWLIDGQQRTTALCTLFGKRPDWWDHNRSGTWDEHLKKFDIRLDVGVEELTFVKRTTSSQRYVPVRDILDSKPEEFFALAQGLVAGGHAYTDYRRSWKTSGEIAGSCKSQEFHSPCRGD